MLISIGYCGSVHRAIGLHIVDVLAVENRIVHCDFDNMN